MDEQFMEAALELAKEAALEGEVPVGCVIVRKGEIVGRGRNRRETAKTALGHAEIEAIADACKNLGGWRLWECEMSDSKCGACGSVCDLFNMEFNHHPTAEYGPLEAESQALLQEFFRDLREKIKDRPKWKKPE